MVRRTPRSTRTDTLFPYTTLFRARHYLFIGGIQWLVDWGVMVALPFRHGHRPGQRRRPDQRRAAGLLRSEEHTSELQSLMRISYAVFCLKKKHNTQYLHTIINNNTTKQTSTHQRHHNSDNIH